MFIAATVPVEKAGDENPLLAAAQSIGEKPAADEQSTAPEQPAPGENGVASFERFMSTFGSPARWAGRS